MREKTNKEQRTGTLQPPPQYRRASEQWLSQTLASLLDPVVHKRHVRTVPGRENVDLYGTGLLFENPNPTRGKPPRRPNWALYANGDPSRRRRESDRESPEGADGQREEQALKRRKGVFEYREPTER